MAQSTQTIQNYLSIIPTQGVNTRTSLVQQELVKLQVDLLENMILNTKVYIETQDMDKFKSSLKTHYSHFDLLLTQIEQKQNTIKELDEKLTKPEKIEKPEKQKKEDLINKLSQVEQEEKQLQHQLDQQKQILSKKLFYREYDCLQKEITGIQKQNAQMEESLKKQQKS